MIAAVLILIVLILLFGAGAVKGWIQGAIAWGVVLLILVLAIAFVADKHRQMQEAREHAKIVAEVRPMILADVALKVGKPIEALIDIDTYDQGVDVYLCGSIAGTSGFGGPNGRQRFLSDGGNTELEAPRASTAFARRSSLHCTSFPDQAAMLLTY